MRKIIMTLIVVLGATALYAQQTTDQATTSNSKSRYITNGFWDNWFVRLNAGAQTYFGDHNKQMKFSERITPAFDIAAGKWFAPFFGTRLMLHGFGYKGATQNGAHSTGVSIPGVLGEEYGLSYQKIDFMNLHIDFMFDISNMIGGYRQDRFWSVQPYIGLGWIYTWSKPTNHSVTYNAGINNALRINDKFNINIDIRGGMLNDVFDGEVGGRSHEGFLSTTVGLTYNFKARGWDYSSRNH